MTPIPNGYLTSHVQLIYVPENKVIADFPNGLNGAPKFPDELKIGETMADRGVAIPAFAEKEFGDKRFVTSNEPNFGRAFFKFYGRTATFFSNHKWIKV